VAFTDKQVRNGADQGGGDGQNTAVPSADVTGDVASAKTQAESAGNAYMLDGHALAGAIAGHTVSFEWDAGLAVNDNEGGGSG